MSPSAQAIEPGNAALLYYQAFLLYEKPDKTMEAMLANFRFGRIEANPLIRSHVEKNRRVIDYILTAGYIPTCDWGYDYSQGLDLAIPHHDHLRHLTFLLLTQARLLAEQGDIQGTMDRILASYNMAMHSIDHPWVTYLIGQALACYTDSVITDILPLISGNVEMLGLLKAELRRVNDAFPPLAQAFILDSEICAASMQRERAQTIIELLKESPDPSLGTERILEGAGNEWMIAQIRGANDTFFETNRKHWFNSIATLVAILESKQPYPETCARLNELEKQLCTAAQDNPSGVLTAAMWPNAARIYQLNVRLHTELNALETALDLYIAKARTGRLPDMLPVRSPLDLFTGQPFGYEKTEDGFVLRGRDQEMLERDKIRWSQYEFKTRK